MWTFGDGDSGSGASTTHTYAEPGTYFAAVVVTDSAGAIATSSAIRLTLNMERVSVTGINIFSSDDTCGLNGETATGFTANTSQAFPITFQISGNNTTNGGTASCLIKSVSTSTPGFSITGANVPLQVPVNASPLLSFKVNCPSSPYTGILTLLMTEPPARKQGARRGSNPTAAVEASLTKSPECNYPPG